MFETIEKNKNLKEFGLYRYDSEEDCYKEKKKNVFSFHYFVVLFTSVIILSAICIVTYTYIRETTMPLKNITFFDLNVTEIIETTTYTASFMDYEEPIALELRDKNRRDDPRPFLYEVRDPQPMGFRFPRENDQNTDSQTFKPLKHKGKNIQEIIKLLEQTDRGKKTRRKNYMQDPFFPYKPQNPSDINLLAVSNYKFAPSIQNQVKMKTPDYPKYEMPQDFSVENPYHKRQKHKVLYNQNNYFNHANKFYHNRIQPYWNSRPQWNNNNQNVNRKKNPAQPMIVHLNLYPKKKKKQNDYRISESNIHQNCTDTENHLHITNTTQFNHLMEQVQHSFYNNNNNNVLHFKFKLNNDNKINDFKYLPSENPQNNNVDIQKSIAFTVLNSNNSQWRPMFVDDMDHQGNMPDRHNPQLQVGEANEYLEESVTLPLPNEIFQKYFNTKPTQKFSDWEWDKIRENPNLVNHRPRFEDRNEKK